MRTLHEYITDMADEVLTDLLPSSVSHNDQLHADVKRAAREVGLNAEMPEFKASMLLACDLLDHLASCLEMTEVEDKEIGSQFITDAAIRLRTLTLWGEDRCPSLDLRQ